ncbi:MAG: FAD-dependent monooxygenase [Acidimicrobiales bacterium]|nr:FAD-dependent monooxygenase [Acidimicrobiales bacterium]
MQAVDVLVVGAGPTGLTVALEAHDHGASVRILDRRPRAFRPSRALIMHPRSLEVLRPLGVTEALLERADAAPAGSLHLGKRAVSVRLTDLPLADTSFPHLSLVRQADVEEVLGQALANRGLAVQRDTAFVEAQCGRDETRSVIHSPGGTDECVSSFLAGCDGVASTVRQLAGIGWRGSRYAEEVLLADVELEGELEGGVAHVLPGRPGLVFAFPLGEQATWRLLLTRPAGRDRLPPGLSGPPVPAQELQERMDEVGLKATIRDLRWSTRVQLQCSLADQFRRGRLFLAGDAAHASSPATGQGMNTGIQDAANLGWKLAFAARGATAPALLDSYDFERRRVARRVLAFTHLAFWGEASTSTVPSILRTIAPLAAPVLPVVLRQRWLLAEAIAALGHLRVGYRHSPLSMEGTPHLSGGPRPGQRLPDSAVTGDDRHVRMHELLAQPGIHVLLQRDADEIDRHGLGRLVSVHRLASATGQAVIAVRPDGHVGYSSATTNEPELRRWLADIGAARPFSPGGR